MMKLYIGRNAGRTACLTLPASRREIDWVFADIGGVRPGEPVLVQEVRTSVPYLEERLKGLDYEKKKYRRRWIFWPNGSDT